MTRVIALGECMVELSLTGPTAAALGYAGDTFNTAVYLSRLGLDVSYATALGAGDPFSSGILGLMAREGVSRELVVDAQGRLPGAYAIQRDDQGERSFFYWRNEAPARDYLQLVDLGVLESAMRGADLVYLSAISLAVIGEAGRAVLMRTLAEVGAPVAFDTNYRAMLWPNPRAGRAAIEAMLPLCRYLSLGAADVQAFGGGAASALARAAAEDGCEVVLREDDRSIEVYADGEVAAFAPEPVGQAVDTTGAGDSFNAGYLAARLAGASIADAVAQGRALAAVVVQHPGAIVPREAMP